MTLGRLTTPPQSFRPLKYAKTNSCVEESLVLTHKHANETYAHVEASGPASPPLGFPAPRVERSENIVAFCYDPSNHSFRQETVVARLCRNNSKDIAYIQSGVILKSTLCGEIVLAEEVEIVSDYKIPVPPKSNQNRPVYCRTGNKVAIKIDQRQKMQKIHDAAVHPIPENPWKEVSTMQLLGDGHPNIAKLKEALYDDTYLYEIMPFYSEGSLYELINHHSKGLGELRARQYFKQILSAIDYMHSSGICHRDISTHNIMLRTDGRKDACVLIDFGMSLRVPHSFLDDHHLEDTTDVGAGTMRRLIHSQSHCGKLRFMAPEMYQMLDFDGLAVDLWSAGVVLFVMLSGHEPYGKPDPKDPGFHDLLDDNYYWEPTKVNPVYSWGHKVSEAALDLLKNMLALDPRHRLTLHEVANHPWLKESEVKM